METFSSCLTNLSQYCDYKLAAFKNKSQAKYNLDLEDEIFPEDHEILNKKPRKDLSMKSLNSCGNGSKSNTFRKLVINEETD